MWFRNIFSRTCRSFLAGYRRINNVNNRTYNNNSENNNCDGEVFYRSPLYGRKFRIISYIGIFFIALLLMISRY